MRQWIITGMNGAAYHGFAPLSYGLWYQPIHHGYPFHSIWDPSHVYLQHHYSYMARADISAQKKRMFI